MYEKRIESSLNRTMNELTRHQMIRRVEMQDEQIEQAEPNEVVIKTFDRTALEGPIRDDRIRLRERQTMEFWDRAMMREEAAQQQAELKKQSQYLPKNLDVKTFLEIAYGDNKEGEAGQNKADPPEISMPTIDGRTSQTQLNAPYSPEQVPGTEQPPASAAG